MKRVWLPDNATVSVSGSEWDSTKARGFGGWGWILAFIVFILVGLGSTDGTETPAAPTPGPSVTAVTR